MNEVIFLPLYSVTKGVKAMGEKSGLNQWNAAGRTRQFGESYVSIPALVRDKFPNFFPERGVAFHLELPSGREVVAKRCQQDGKALMTSPNADLCTWLFIQIDGSLEASIRRFVRKKPYRYDELETLGADSFKVTKYPNAALLYKLELGNLGDYENQFK